MNTLSRWRRTRSFRSRRWKNRVGYLKGFSGCYRCRDSWHWKKEHCTPYGGGKGCFPLCEHCWASLTPQERLPYYAQLMMTWRKNCRTQEMLDDTVKQWPSIKAAVLAGK